MGFVKGFYSVICKTNRLNWRLGIEVSHSGTMNGFFLKRVNMGSLTLYRLI